MLYNIVVTVTSLTKRTIKIMIKRYRNTKQISPKINNNSYFILYYSIYHCRYCKHEFRSSLSYSYLKIHLFKLVWHDRTSETYNVVYIIITVTSLTKTNHKNQEETSSKINNPYQQTLTTHTFLTWNWRNHHQSINNLILTLTHSRSI